MGNTPGSRRGESDGPPERLDEVSQMLQAYLGDEPTLNMTLLKPGAANQMDVEAREAARGSKDKKRMIPTVFRWQGRHCREVMISGSFNEWKKLPLVRSRDNFFTIVDLEEGRHEYKFFVDGQWRHDERGDTIPNPLGTLNNYIQVDGNDLDVFEALVMEGNVGAKKVNKYSQDVPTRKWIEEAGNGGPQVLPPHLLEAHLNQDTAVRNEPDLLPSPNHVMLNHLYALAIRDGVLVLGASHRYRTKFITSLYYKPCKVGG